MAEWKAKKPATFHYLPRNRGNLSVVFPFLDLTWKITAKKLKRSWVDSKKLKSQWKAQKKREGIWNKPSSQPDNCGGEMAEQACLNGASDPPVESDRKAAEDTLLVDKHSAETSTTNQVSLRELKRQAYSPSTLHTHKSDPVRKRRDTNASSPHSVKKDPSHHTKGQPNMKLRMNAMLEKIKRDLC
ncbi:hypothetical protein M404DRAFT_19035 [Pisolithus tinctorius Marx 270]|uniref:Uncharacterized protein n=1 Tax=Pisolithus tinctorius Marx 270 TaxID=870435 RepID=A0A0C3PXA8_PISTI|nr:hypothetical protein M404DRAFT_19035 [Pisolithus tinctorius Marx 270]